MPRLKMVRDGNVKVTSRPELLVSAPALYALTFSVIWLLHAPLLRLPYFWDEAGYFVPAARDLLLRHELIASSTLSNAHPPLLMAWLALWWKLSGYTPAVTRTAMLLIAAFALLGVFRLGRQIANIAVAAAATFLTALFPVFFTQSSMAHLDMAAAAFTLWALVFYTGHQRGRAILFFILAALSKETAIIAPLALLGWELLCPLLAWRHGSYRDICLYPRWRWERSLALLAPLLPLAIWYTYHFTQTGYIFGNAEFFRYNVQATLQPTRILLAILARLWQLLLYLNMFVLTASAALALLYSPLRRGGHERRAIAVPIQLALAVVIAAYIVVMAVVGGAVLARYLLPVYPLVILICVSTLRQRVSWWPAVVGVVAVAFVAGLFVQPSYRISPEDNLTYSDFVRLHKSAASWLAARKPDRVLTAWPASDELQRPYLGYVKEPVPTLAIENFSLSQLLLAAQERERFSHALLFSTKYEPARPLLAGRWWSQLQERFFDYHQDLPPELAASMLGGRIVFQESRGQEWVAVIAIDQIRNVELRRRSQKRPS